VTSLWSITLVIQRYRIVPHTRMKEHVLLVKMTSLSSIIYAMNQSRTVSYMTEKVGVNACCVLKNISFNIISAINKWTIVLHTVKILLGIALNAVLDIYCHKIIYAF
jgi:hypothetical protein